MVKGTANMVRTRRICEPSLLTPSWLGEHSPLNGQLVFKLSCEVKENSGSPKDAANSRPNSALRLQPTSLAERASGGAGGAGEPRGGPAAAAAHGARPRPVHRGGAAPDQAQKEVHRRAVQRRGAAVLRDVVCEPSGADGEAHLLAVATLSSGLGTGGGSISHLDFWGLICSELLLGKDSAEGDHRGGGHF
eukprot:1186007-Prorocentrum_minimum.AAC.3